MPAQSDQYPLVYRIPIGWRLFLGAAGLAMLVGGAVGLGYFTSGHDTDPATSRLIMLVVCLGLGALGLSSFASAILEAEAITLFKDTLRVSGIFRDKIVRRQDIVGFRVVQYQYGRVLRIQTASTKGRGKVNVSLIFTPDDAFLAWFKGIRDLDAEDYAQSLHVVDANEALGRSVEQRRLNAARANKFATVLFLVSIGVCGWFFMYPHPYMLAFGLVAALPWLALWLVWRYRGAFSVDDSGNITARGGIAGILFMPGLIISLRALKDVQLVSPSDLIVPTVIGLIILMGCVAYVAPVYRKRISKLLMLAAVMWAYPASTIAIVDAQFDTSPPEHFQAQVLKKYVTTGRGGGSQHFIVQAWGPFEATNNVLVPMELYLNTRVGDTVCLSLRAGAIGMPWYSVDGSKDCDPGALPN